MESAAGTEIRKSLHDACQPQMPEGAEGKPPVITCSLRRSAKLELLLGQPLEGTFEYLLSFLAPAESPIFTSVNLFLLKTKAGPVGPARSEY